MPDQSNQLLLHRALATLARKLGACEPRGYFSTRPCGEQSVPNAYDSKQCSRAWLTPGKACTERAEAPKGAINSIVQTSEYDPEEYSRGYLTSREDPKARDDSPNADEDITETGEYDLQGTF